MSQEEIDKKALAEIEEIMAETHRMHTPTEEVMADTDRRFHRAYNSMSAAAQKAWIDGALAEDSLSERLHAVLNRPIKPKKN